MRRNTGKRTRKERSSRTLTPEGAQNLIMRFLSNPCPGIAAIILERRDEIDHIVRTYRRMLRSGRLIAGYVEGVNLFLKSFEQVESAIEQFGYGNLERIDNEALQLLKMPRIHRC